jgi:chromosome partitioning protein
MRRIAIINQKGGVGKTTTTVNVGTALARAGHRVMMIDLDPQAHMTMHLGVDPASGHVGLYEMLTSNASVAKARHKVTNNLWTIGSSIDLAGAEIELVNVVGREVILRDLLDQHISASRTPQYDYILMDCPPSLGVLTLNALAAANEVFIPLQPHYLALQGLSKLLETVALVNRRINPALKVSGVIVCMNDKGTRLAAEVVEDVQSFFEQARGTDVPWSETRVFETSIRRNIKLAESPSYGQSIFEYAPDSNGANDYAQLAQEINTQFGDQGQTSIESSASQTDAPSSDEQSSTSDQIDPALTEPMQPKPFDPGMKEIDTSRLPDPSRKNHPPQPAEAADMPAPSENSQADTRAAS